MQTPPATRQIAKKAYFSDYMEFAPQQYESFRKEPTGPEKVAFRRSPITNPQEMMWGTFRTKQPNPVGRCLVNNISPGKILP